MNIFCWGGDQVRGDSISRGKSLFLGNMSNGPTKAILLVILLLISGEFLSAQESARISLPAGDSLNHKPEVPYDQGVPQMINETFFSSPEMPSFSLEVLAPGIGGEGMKMAVFDFSQALMGWRSEGLSSFPFFWPGGRWSTPGAGAGGSLFMPFRATLFSQAYRQLNNRLTIGGNSFGVTPPWAVPFRGTGDTHYDWRGASMFMEYKVNRNFRISTRVSVSGSPRHP